VLNRAHDLAPDTRHPVATIQLNGRNLIEVDEFPGLIPPQIANCGLPAGISMISFAVTGGYLAGDLVDAYISLEEPFSGSRARLLKGSGGELIEIIER